MKKSALKKLHDFDVYPQQTGQTKKLRSTLGLDRTQAATMLALDKIVANEEQPRKYSSKEKFADLVLSVRERGVLQAIRVRELKPNEAYEIVAGERRWRAANEVGLKEIPAVIVQDQSREQAYVDALLENVIREDLNAIDRANALAQVRVHLGAQSWDEIGKLVGLRHRQIYNLLGLTSLPEPVQDDIRKGVLTEKHGRALRLLRSDPKLLERARKTMKTKKLSGDAALELVKKLKGSGEKVSIFKVSYKTESELIAALESKLRELRGDEATA